MTERLVDLHIHTTASDGTYSPAEVVRMAKEAELAAIAITDHDTTSGIAEAIEAGNDVGLEVISGIELSANHNDISFHILGYFIDPDNVPLNERLEQVRRFREERNPKIVAKLNECDLDITIEECMAKATGDTLGRPHIASVLVEKGYVKDTQKAFDKYLASGKAAYVERDRISSQQAIDYIRGAGGLPILAHPGIYDLSRERLVGIITELKDMGICGIETIYSLHKHQFTLDMNQLANELGLLITGGSDFHGAAKPAIQPGVGFGNMRIPYEIVETLKSALRPPQ